MEANVLKAQETVLTEELLQSLVGKTIHCPVNYHTTVQNLTGEDSEVNVWFAGMVAGYEKIYLAVDLASESNVLTITEPRTDFRLIMTDGASYALADQSKVLEITDQQLAEMVKKHRKEQGLKDLLILPEQWA